MQVCQCVINESQGMMIRHLRVVILNLACVLIVTQLSERDGEARAGPARTPPSSAHPTIPCHAQAQAGETHGAGLTSANV